MLDISVAHHFPSGIVRLSAPLVVHVRPFEHIPQVTVSLRPPMLGLPHLHVTVCRPLPVSPPPRIPPPPQVSRLSPTLGLDVLVGCQPEDDGHGRRAALKKVFPLVPGLSHGLVQLVHRAALAPRRLREGLPKGRQHPLRSAGVREHDVARGVVDPLHVLLGSLPAVSLRRRARPRDGV